MRRRLLTIIPAVAALVVLAAGCGSAEPKVPLAPQTEVTELKVASTALGKVVTDANGRTLYMFTQDTQGGQVSACSGDCRASWLPAFSGAAAPKLNGVTGAVATIDSAGKKQLTLAGWPLYYYAQDAAAGELRGQGVGGVWYVLDAAGAPVKTTIDQPGGIGY